VSLPGIELWPVRIRPEVFGGTRMTRQSRTTDWRAANVHERLVDEDEQALISLKKQETDILEDITPKTLRRRQADEE